MSTWAGKRYWVVGASEGLGRALAHKLSAAGAQLVLSARTRERLEDLAAELPAPAEVLPMDVADRASVQEAAAAAGEVDGLVYLAGVYWPQSALAWNAEQVEAMCDINFTGCVRVLGAVVPGMVERDSGHVVITGSFAAYRGLPGAIGYGASKAALMSLAESMAVDLQDTSVRVQLVNPGFIRTRLTAKNAFRMRGMMSPEEAAQEIFEHMNSRTFKRVFPWWLGAYFRALQFVPDGLYFRMFRYRG